MDVEHEGFHPMVGEPGPPATDCPACFPPPANAGPFPSEPELVEYRVTCPDRPDLGTMSPLNPWDLREALRIAARLSAGEAETLFGLKVPATRAQLEYRHVTKWAPLQEFEVIGVPI